MNAQLSIASTSIRQLDGLYSLNDLHAASGSDTNNRPNQFVRLDQTKALVNEINRCADVRNALVTKRGGEFQGTFACKEIVYAYAMWISPAFMLKVIRAYDSLVSPATQATQLATANQKLQIRRMVENKAKSIGGTRSDYSIVS